MFRAQPACQIEAIDDLLHERFGLIPQITALAALRQLFTLAAADAFTFDRNRLHARVDRPAFHQRNGQCQHGRGGGDRDDDLEDRLRITEGIDEEVQHASRSLNIEADHLAHRHDANRHPDPACGENKKPR